MQWLRRIWAGDPTFRRTFESDEVAWLTRAVIGFFVCQTLGSTFKVLAHRGVFFTRSSAETAGDILLGAAMIAMLIAGFRLHRRLGDARRIVRRHRRLVCPACLYPCSAIEHDSPAACTECGGYLVHDEIMSFWKREFPGDVKEPDHPQGPTS